MKEVSIYIVTGIRGRWQQDGHIGYALEYYKENSKYPAVIKEVVPVQQQNENRSTLEALIMALHRMREKCILTVYTESKYLYNGYEDAEYVKRWKQNDVSPFVEKNQSGNAVRAVGVRIYEPKILGKTDRRSMPDGYSLYVDITGRAGAGSQYNSEISE